MKKILIPMSVLFFSAVLFACGQSGNVDEQEAGTSDYAGDNAGLTSLAKDLDASQDMSLLKELEPSLEDCKAIFNDESDAMTAHAMIKKQFAELGGCHKTRLVLKKGRRMF